MLYVQVSETNCLIEMYDSYGRQIVVNAKDANTSEALHVFNLKTLATGVYFIRVKSAKDEVIAVGSFVKE